MEMSAINLYVIQKYLRDFLHDRLLERKHIAFAFTILKCLFCYLYGYMVWHENFYFVIVILVIYEYCGALFLL